MKNGPKQLVAAGFPDRLRKRERAGMATAMALASTRDAFSICFDFKPKHVRTIIYFKQPKKASEEQTLEPEEDDEDDDEEEAPAPVPAEAGATRKEPPPKPPPKPKPSKKAGVEVPRTTITPAARQLLGLDTTTRGSQK